MAHKKSLLNSPICIKYLLFPQETRILQLFYQQDTTDQRKLLAKQLKPEFLMTVAHSTAVVIIYSLFSYVTFNLAQ